MEKVTDCIKLVDFKKESMRQSFDQAQAQASSILSLTLQWKDFENHIEFAKDSLLKQARELDLQAKKIAQATEMLDRRDQEVEIDSKKVQKRFDELQMKEKHLHSVKEQIQEVILELSSKEKQLSLAQKEVEGCNNMLTLKKEELALVQNEHEECSKELSVKKKQLGMIDRLIDECTGTLNSKEMKLSSAEVLLEECCKDLSVKNEQLESVNKSLQVCSGELKVREMEIENLKIAAINFDEELESKQKALIMVKSLTSNCDSDLESKQKQLDALQEFDAAHKSMQECLKELDLKKGDLSRVQKLIEESLHDLYSKEKHLDSIKLLIDEYTEVLESKEKQHDAINMSINKCSAELSVKQKHLDSIQVLIRERSEELEAKEEQFGSLNDSINKCSAELKMKQTELIDKSVKQSSELHSKEKKLESKEKDLISLKETIKTYNEDLELKEREFNAICQSIRERDKEFALKEKQLKSVELSIIKSNEELEALKKQQLSIEESIRESTEELEAKKKNLDLVERSLKECCKELTLKEAELDSIKRMTSGFHEKIEQREKYCDSLQRTLKERLEKLEMKERKYEACAKELEIREQCIKEREKHHDSLTKALQDRSENREMKERQIELCVEELELREQEIEERGKNCDSLEKTLEERSEKLEMKERKFEVCAKELKLRELKIEEREKHCDSLERTLEERLEKLEMKERQIKVCGEKLELREQQIDWMQKSVKDHSKQVELKQKQSYDNFLSQGMIGKSQDLMTNIERETSNSFTAGYKCCITDNGRYLQFLLNENLRKHDLFLNEVSTAIQKSRDPAKLVLDAMQGFYPTAVKKGNREFDLSVIRKSCTILLWKLLKISPMVKPEVREEAMKLAREWRSRMRTVSENSLEVLGFLQLLAAFKLGSSFSHAEVQTFLDAVHHHEQALELRQALRLSECVPVTSTSATSVRIEQIDHLQAHSPEFSSIACIQSGEGIDGRTSPLILYDDMGDHDLMPHEVLAALVLSPDPAKFVLGVMQGSYSQHWQNSGSELDAGVIKSNIVLLEQLIRVSPRVSPMVKEEAMKLAVFWKANVRLETEKSMEVWAFLVFLAIYGLASYFKVDEILRFVLIAAHYRLAPEICRGLGFTTQIPGLIQILIQRKQYVEAARFSCAFRLVHYFPPENILQKCLEHIKGVAQGKAIEKELSVLKAILQCISDYKLESIYYTQNIISRIFELEKQRASSQPSSSATAIDISSSKDQQSPSAFLGQHLHNQHYRDGLQRQGNNKRPRNDISVDRSSS